MTILPPCRGATRVAEALKTNSVVKKLCIQGCQITKVGATSLAEMLRINQTLSNIDYSDNDIGAEGHTLLTQAWNSTRSAESHRMVVSGGRFSNQTTPQAISDHLAKGAPTSVAKATLPKSQFEWAKDQLLASQAKSRVRRR